jgi:predicted amidohydrolase YtcJ
MPPARSLRRSPSATFLAVFLASAGVTLAPVGAADPPADLILTGARVWTAEAKRPWAEAVAVRADRIVYVGDAKGASAYRGQKTEVRELAGRLVLPGFNDSHVHLMSGAQSLERVDLIEEGSLEAVQARIKAFADANPKSPWVLGRGWLYGTFPGGLPTRAQLDAVVPDRPAYMECYDGHSGWANSKALALAGITKATKDPENGVIVRDPATGDPTGALKEAATALVESKIPVPDPEARYALLLRALQLLNSQGITSVQDAGSSDPAEDAPLYARAKQYGRLSVRLSIATNMKEGDVERPIAQAQNLRTQSADHLLRFGTIKGFVDGVIEAKTAAVLEPYPEGGAGLPNWRPETLQAAVVAADKAGLQVYLHAIGDRGVRMALDAHAAAAKANGPRDRRGRIEHIETVSAADQPRFAALGVIAAMQPLHADPNQNLVDVWEKNAGPDRASRGFGWATLERTGARLAFGSDWPVVTSDVRRGLYCAVTRKTREGTPAGGWHPEQAVTLDSALRHYTIDAAYASFEEGVKGSLAPGKLADLVVLEDDIFKAPPETILKTRILLTMLGGRVVYKAD